MTMMSLIQMTMMSLIQMTMPHFVSTCDDASLHASNHPRLPFIHKPYSSSTPPVARPAENPSISTANFASSFAKSVLFRKGPVTRIGRKSH